MNEYQANLDAHRLLSKLYSEAWGQPAEVPTQIALMLLHARDYMGARVKAYFADDLSSSSLSALGDALNAGQWDRSRHKTSDGVQAATV